MVSKHHFFYENSSFHLRQFLFLSLLRVPGGDANQGDDSEEEYEEMDRSGSKTVSICSDHFLPTQYCECDLKLAFNFYFFFENHSAVDVKLLQDQRLWKVKAAPMRRVAIMEEIGTMVAK